jgi:hypothetical protein
VPALVGAFIGAAYWFTASTSFANPAVTIARCLRPHLPASGRPTYRIRLRAGGRFNVALLLASLPLQPEKPSVPPIPET